MIIMLNEATPLYATVLDGKGLATQLRRHVTDQVTALDVQHSIQPGLAMIVVGDDPASQSYVRSKHKATLAAGMNSDEHYLPATTTQDELLELIHELNNDARINGILVELPLPDHIANSVVLRAIDPAKDVDGFHVINAGCLWNDEEALAPCTPTACILLMKQALVTLDGCHAVVIGCSNIVGKPLAGLLLRENATVTLAHDHTRNLPALCREGDILVSAAGKPGLVQGDWIKPGATVIDVGINRVTDQTTGKNHLVGDVAFNQARTIAGAITPVPGGVGPITIACLLQNTITATYAQHAIERKSLSARA